MVHKNENLFGFDFEFCTTCISMLVMHNLKDFSENFFLLDQRLFRLVLRLRGMKKNFQDSRPKFLKSYMTLKYLLIIDFPKFDPLTAAEMVLCGNLGLK
jgi:hypothetical protein